uniref:Uncharacterized protein n=1 Tax=Glossina pallidipes TaxID=7398 RepID=A0A1A9ZYE8_GLOPL
MDEEKNFRTHRFSTIIQHGCSKDLYQKIRYAQEKLLEKRSYLARIKHYLVGGYLYGVYTSKIKNGSNKNSSSSSSSIAAQAHTIYISRFLCEHGCCRRSTIVHRSDMNSTSSIK